MSKYPIPDKLTKAAMAAHCNLNIFAAIAAILEAGVIYGGENAAAKKIMAICTKEQQRQLLLQDKAVASMAAHPANGAQAGLSDAALVVAVERMQKAHAAANVPARLPAYDEAHEYQAAVQALIKAAVAKKGGALYQPPAPAAPQDERAAFCTWYNAIPEHELTAAILKGYSAVAWLGYQAGAALTVKAETAANAPVASAVTRLLSPETGFIGATIDHRRYGSGWEKPYRAKLVSNKIPCELFGDTAEEAAQAVLDFISKNDAGVRAYFAAPTPPMPGEA